MGNVLKPKYCNYLIGISWFLLSLVVSVTNDTIAKKVGQNLPEIEVAFLRFSFSLLTLIPFMLYYGKKSFKTQRPLLHVARGALLFGGITLWCYGLNIVPLASATVINFTIPLFTLLLAIFFLNEKVGSVRWIATFVGFFGVFVVLDPSDAAFKVTSLILLVSAFMFATLDVINKKFVIKETMLSMLFYSAVVTTVLSAPFALLNWQTPSSQDLLLMFILGGGANLILFFLLKAFTLVDASAVAPFRYLELFLSYMVGYLYFGELLSGSFWIGALIIVACSFFVVYFEAKQQKKAKS